MRVRVVKEMVVHKVFFGLFLALAASIFLTPNVGCFGVSDFSNIFDNLINGGENNDGDDGTGDDGTGDDGTGDDGTGDDGTGDDGTGDDGTGDDGTGDDGTSEFTIVKTGVVVRHDAGLECGDDLIAFGTDTLTGVSYVVPSENPTAGTPVPDNALYASKGFAVGGKTIFLVGSNTGSLAFQVSVLDTTTGTITKTFDATEIRLNGIPVGADDPGHIQADGDYCVVVCDENEVTDGKIFKVIDVSGAEPALYAFDQNPTDYANGVEQVAVDAATQRAIAATSDSLYVYDISDPAAAPDVIALPNGMGSVQMKVHEDYLIALDDQGYTYVLLVNLATGDIVEPTDGEGVYGVAVASDIFAFFSYNTSDDASGGHHRAAVGELPGPGFDKHAMDDYIDGSTTNNGLVGYAGTVCIPPQGGYVFLSDWYFQYSLGGVDFIVPDDPDGTDPWGCPAWDIDCSANVVGFKTAADRGLNTDTTLGYVILP